VQARGQIIYTDVIPDQVFTTSGAICHLDLNNDGTDDFLIRLFRSAGTGCSSNCSPVLHPHPSYVHINPQAGNGVAVLGDEPRMMAPFTLVDSLASWEESSEQLLSDLSTHCVTWKTAHLCFPFLRTGAWASGLSVDSSRYLGLRFTAGGSTFYGWARISIPHASQSIASFTLKDYAFNSTPDEMILAGDTVGAITTSLPEVFAPSIRISPNPFNTTLLISIGTANSDEGICSVSTLTGQRLLSRTIPISSRGSSFTLDLETLTPGMYLLEVMIDKERVVQKVLKE
jgi:hypothetical protein